MKYIWKKITAKWKRKNKSAPTSTYDAVLTDLLKKSPGIPPNFKFPRIGSGPGAFGSPVMIFGDTYEISEASFEALLSRVTNRDDFRGRGEFGKFIVEIHKGIGHVVASSENGNYFDNVTGSFKVI